MDLFCGAGGLSLGLKEAGFTTLVGADSDPIAIETFVANIGGLGYLGDLSDVGMFLDHLEAWGINSVDLVAGGVPCQPFSRAGQSKVRSLVQSGLRPKGDPRTELWRPFVAVVERLNPRMVLLENVPDLATWREGSVLVGFREQLRKMGYRTHVKILNAFDYGVPQHRARLFVVGTRLEGAFPWPRTWRHRNNLRDAIGDLPEAPPAQREESLPYDQPVSPLQKRLRRGVPRDESGKVYDHITRDIRPDDAEAFSLLGEGDTYMDLPK
ncbi:MAG TPA: DNA (cytosine-5-)-methyltransferase, partial [Bacillota bacterium]